jgi:DNA replication protein DnaC
MDDRAAELQQRLEANRESVSQPSSPSKPAVEHLPELLPCSGCQDPVKIMRLFLDGEPAPVPGVLCDKCHAEEERIFGGELPEKARKDIREVLGKYGINMRRYGEATIATLDGNLRAVCKRYAERLCEMGRYDRVDGLYLVGPTGTGKTHAAVAVVRALLETGASVSVKWDSADRLVTRVQDSYGTGTTDSLIQERAGADVYVLDDLGREKGTEDALRVLAMILDEREGSPTIITSNFMPHELAGRHKDDESWHRVESRLGDKVYRFISVDGADRRFKGE